MGQFEFYDVAHYINPSITSAERRSTARSPRASVIFWGKTKAFLHYHVPSHWDGVFASPVMFFTAFTSKRNSKCCCLANKVANKLPTCLWKVTLVSGASKSKTDALLDQNIHTVEPFSWTSSSQFHNCFYRIDRRYNWIRGEFSVMTS